jgi:hypothetical protein
VIDDDEDTFIDVLASDEDVTGALIAPTNPHALVKPGIEGLQTYLLSGKAETDSGLWCYLRAQASSPWVHRLMTEDGDDEEAALHQRILEYANANVDDEGWCYGMAIVKDLGLTSLVVTEALALAGWLPQSRKHNGVSRNGWMRPEGDDDA